MAIECSIPYQALHQEEEFFYTSENGLEIFGIIPPACALPPSVELSFAQKTLAILDNIERKLCLPNSSLPEIIEELEEVLSQAVVEGIVAQESADHFSLLIQELPRQAEVDAVRYLKWNLRLLLIDIKGESMAVNERIHRLYERIIEKNFDLKPRESYGHSPSFFLHDKDSGLPFAILKESKPLFNSSFTKHLPAMPLSSPVWEHELIACEQDLLFGFDHLPTTFSVHFVNDQKEEVMGSIQEYIPNSKAGSDFYDYPGGADLLKGISKHHLHTLALSGFFKQITAGHMSNYILQVGKSGEEEWVTAVFEIDLEESLLPYNQLTEVDSLEVGEALATNREEAIKSLILCRMWILGLPQMGEAFDRATLMMMANPSIIRLLEKYQGQAGETTKMDQQCWAAQLQRVKKMQDICRSELEKEVGMLTPRDLYFKLFGGEHLWKIAQEKRYPAMVAFNNFVSDPYQHIVKNFSDLSSIPECRRLDEPREQTEEAIAIMNFLRKMEGLN